MSKKKVRRPVVRIDNRTFNLMSYWAFLGGNKSQEITCLGLTEVRDGHIYIKGAHLVGQEGTSGSVDGDDEAIVALMMELDAEGISPETMRCWVHSHPGNGEGSTYLSGTDEQNIDRWLTGEYLVSIVFDSKGGSAYTRVDIKNPRMSIEVDLEKVFLEKEDVEWAQKEFKEKVRRANPTVYQSQYQGQGRTPSHWEGEHWEGQGYYGGEYYNHHHERLAAARGGYSKGSSASSSSSTSSSKSKTTSDTKSFGSGQKTLPPANKPQDKSEHKSNVVSMKANEAPGSNGRDQKKDEALGNAHCRPGHHQTEGGLSGYGLTDLEDTEFETAWEKLAEVAESEGEREKEEEKGKGNGIPIPVKKDDTERQLGLGSGDGDGDEEETVLDELDIQFIENIREAEKYIEDRIDAIAMRVSFGHQPDIGAAVKEIAQMGISEEQAWEELHERLIA